MKVIIVEDEIAASDNLAYLLNSIDKNIEVITVLDSVKASVKYFSKPNDADLILMDIHLADGISFEIFDQVSISTPVIFTTAYDQYAVKAFKVNSIDYLLKPIDEDELSTALNKLRGKSSEDTSDINSQMEGLLSLLQNKSISYKSTFLVQKRDELIPVNTEDIAFFYIESGIVKAVNFQNHSFIIDKKLEDVEVELNPIEFFRANRQFIIRKNAIENIRFYFNGKLIINTNPPFSERIIVSKAKATAFKRWMDS